MKHLKKLIVFFILISLILLINAIDMNMRSKQSGKSPFSDKSAYIIEAVEIRSTGNKGILESLYDEHITDTVERGYTLSYMLSKAGFSAYDSSGIINVISEYISPKNMSLNSEYAVYYSKGIPNVFEISIDAERKLRIRKGSEDIWEPVIIQTPMVAKETVVKGSIRSSLYSAVNSIENSGILAVELSDIYSYDIDFFSDLRVNDLFIIIVDKLYIDESFQNYDKIKASAMYVNNRIYKAFYFNDKELGGYYNESGQSMEKDFLKAPLNYRRISSHFSPRRFHPVLKRYAAHNGIDYAAPHGTPVVALGDGEIVRAGWNGGLGNYIEIKHNKVYNTGYGHLSGYARGIKRGAHVKKGQLIGYVGATGLATGPHLDFRVIRGGKFINPLSLKPSRKIDLEGEKLELFLAEIRAYNQEFDRFFLENIEISSEG